MSARAQWLVDGVALSLGTWKGKYWGIGIVRFGWRRVDLLE